jgi:hypothetical protein
MRLNSGFLSEIKSNTGTYCIVFLELWHNLGCETMVTVGTVPYGMVPVRTVPMYR